MEGRSTDACRRVTETQNKRLLFPGLSASAVKNQIGETMLRALKPEFRN